MADQEFVSLTKEYRAVVGVDGLLRVYNMSPPTIQVIKSTSDGGLDFDFVTSSNVQTASEKRLLAYKRHASVFTATWAGDQQWNIDADCGFQRWNGVKSHRNTCAALKKCGFETKQVKEISKICREAGTWNYAPRHW